MLWSFCLASPVAWAASSTPVKSAHTTVSLVSEHTAARQGSEVTLGIRMRMDPKWHTYWRFPGDSGLKTAVKWDLPQGVTAGEIQWPRPHYTEAFELAVFGYEGEVLLPVTLHIPASFEGDSITIRGTVTYLACEDECIPGESDHTLTLPITDAEPAVDPAVAELFENARAQLPEPIDPQRVSLTPHPDGTITLTVVGVDDHASQDARDVEAHFFTDQMITWNLTAPQSPKAERGVVTLTLTPLDASMRGTNKPVDTASGVLVVGHGSDAKAYRITGTSDGLASLARADDAQPEQGDTAATTDAVSSSPPVAPPITLPVALLSAFIGGIILNVMPCVFPVVSIKVLGFVQQAGEDRARTRMHGLVFAAGVLISFWVLAGVLLAVIAAGKQVGWGFQFTSPAFVGAMTLLMFAIGLNLMGVFEVGMSAVGLAGRAQSGVDRHSYHASFFSGALATLIATPCTAPVLGGAVGFAVMLGSVQAMLVFTAMGLGMAMPYVLLSAFPGWLNVLPKPGAWMETFKQLMAFPVFATVIFLVYVFGKLTGGTVGITVLLTALLTLGVAAWVYGRWSVPSRSAAARWTAVAFALLFVACSGLILAAAPEAQEADAATADAQAAADAQRWEPFDEDRIAELRSQGRPVFVDYTADWCTSCKYNEKVVLASGPVRDAFAAADVVLMKADWTHQPEHITQSLRQFGRASVPLYLMYSPDVSEAPQVLPTILTRGSVMEAIGRAAIDDAAASAEPAGAPEGEPTVTAVAETP